MVVRALNGTRLEVRGEINLPVHIGPHTCQVTFQIMDINPAYSCLLGRPWIHSGKYFSSITLRTKHLTRFQQTAQSVFSLAGRSSF